MKDLREALERVVAMFAERGDSCSREATHAATELLYEHGPALLAAVRDGERYRWLRERELTISKYSLVLSDQSARLDQHIDAAMQATPEAGGSV